ncbi:ABC transporter permease [Mucilaginibacter limnophilus]|uniref:ABC transporter permease n=1 Tax=Mucilaginibacter limnophilus TaxID=1932778 RepID=A0A437MW06_9SPHI|nr:ABC transporter permease [Mucilaginibacter limnophilus]RVU01817.1 ABC transporter permease [Mucilaginibacter limnophilus]
MKAFLLSFRSEFYKSRKTLGFWCAVLLPLLICLLMFIGFYSNSDKLIHYPGMSLWMRFAGGVLNVTGTLLLPMFIVFTAYSVNSVEHKADSWKTLFSLPLPKMSVYAAKFIYALFLVFLCLALFVLFISAFGTLLGTIKPELKFSEYRMECTLMQIYFKLLLSSLGILSIQFLLSLLWKDFLKPMGIGFVGTISGVIMGAMQWKYAYLFPYSHPMLALTNMMPRGKPDATPTLHIDIFTKDVYISMAVAAVVFVCGYFIVLKKSVK